MPRLRVQIGGTIATAGEWSNTLEFALGSTIDSQATLQTVMNAIRTSLAASANFKAAYGSDTILLSVKGLYYPTNTGTATLVAEAGGAGVAGSSSSIHAPQVAIVASLRTGLAGRSYRGRTYVPYRGSNIAASGAVNGAGQTAVAAYVNAVASAVISALASSSIASTWGVWSKTKGTISPVSAVLVGSQCDTIRHRNDNRDEVYTSFAVTVPTVTPSDESDAERLAAAAAQLVPVFTGEPIDVQTAVNAGFAVGELIP